MSTLGIIPSYLAKREHMDYTTKAIQTFLDTTSAPLMVIDDGSPAKALKNALAKFCEDRGGDRITFHAKRKNEGFAATVNVGIRAAKRARQNALLVNADIEFFEFGWLDAMEANDADVVGAMLMYANGLVQHAGVYYSVIQRNFDHIHRLAPHTMNLVQLPRICPVTGALMLIKLDTIKSIGLMDENFPMGYEDVDYCHMVFKAGLKCAYEPKARAIHHESMIRNHDPDSRIQAMWDESWRYLHEKHAGHSFASYVPTMIWPGEVDGTETV